MKTTTAALLLLSLAACSKPGGPPAPAAPAAAPTMPAAPPTPGFRDARTLLSDDKVLSAYAVYQKEMGPHAKEAMEIFSSAYRKAGSDAKKLEAAAKDDPRITAYNKLNDAALAKAGLTQAEVSTLTGALTGYTTSLMMVRDGAKAKEEAAKKKAAGAKPGLGEQIALEMAGEADKGLAKARAEFLAANGQAALDAVGRHATELVEAQDALLKGAMAR